jgi:hypothetical protein
LSINALKRTTTHPTHLYTPTMASPAHDLPTPSTRKRDNSYPSTMIPGKRSKPTTIDATSTTQEDTTPSTLPYPTSQPPHSKRPQQPSAEISKAWRRRSSPDRIPNHSCVTSQQPSTP